MSVVCFDFFGQCAGVAFSILVLSVQFIVVSSCLTVSLHVCTANRGNACLSVCVYMSGLVNLPPWSPASAESSEHPVKEDAGWRWM